jgi:hypothetical protein
LAHGVFGNELFKWWNKRLLTWHRAYEFPIWTALFSVFDSGLVAVVEGNSPPAPPPPDTTSELPNKKMASKRNILSLDYQKQ